MASAILASRNEPCWGETKVYMRKTPNSNPNPNPNPKPAPSPNPNPNTSPDAGDHASDRPGQFHTPECDEPPAVNAAVSDGSSSFNRKSAPPRESGGYAAFNISAYSRTELRELKRRLVSELEQVRSILSRIESREIQSSARSIGYSTSEVYGCGREVTSSGGLHPSHLHPRDSLVAGSDVLPERPGPRTNQFYQPPEFRLGKERRPFGAGNMVGSPRVKGGQKRSAAAPESEKNLAGMMSKCRQILTKLMKHKGNVWFNSPVDAVGMGLHDYHQIIKHPMDLGTAKSKLTKGLYSSPLEFAADIRLTFNNALLYNPEGHEVQRLAGQLLRLFEGEFSPAHERYEKKAAAIARDEEMRRIAREEEEMRRIAREEEEMMRRSSVWSQAQIPDSAVRSEPAMRSEPVPVISPESPPPPPPLALAPAPAPVDPPVNAEQEQEQEQEQAQQQQHVMGKPVMTGKLPKPKAKDPNKRPMSFEEKERLSEELQRLPQEKMALLLQIVRRRNGDPVQHGDEIELDFEVMDMETLWELDRFVGNFKKTMSKMRRQEAMATNQVTAPVPAEVGDESPASKRIKRSDPGEEEVDIGEEVPSANYPSVEIEKDAGCASSSSSSDSDSSSSSDSDSESSSGSDSDNGEAASPAPGLRPSPRN